MIISMGEKLEFITAYRVRVRVRFVSCGSNYRNTREKEGRVLQRNTTPFNIPSLRFLISPTKKHIVVYSTQFSVLFLGNKETHRRVFHSVVRIFSHQQRDQLLCIAPSPPYFFSPTKRPIVVYCTKSSVFFLIIINIAVMDDSDGSQSRITFVIPEDDCDSTRYRQKNQPIEEFEQWLNENMPSSHYMYL